VSLQRALIVVAVLAAHMLLLSVLWTVAHQALPDRPNSQVARPDRSPTIVYLLESPAPAVIQPPPDQAHQDARPTRAERKGDSAVAPVIQGDEVSNTAALSSAVVSPLSTGQTPAEVPKPSGSSLNLTLSREALKSLPPSLAASSPFRRRLPVTVESKIAEAAAETGPWTEERLDNDHIRLRRGTTCTTISRPEIAKIDPFSSSIRNLPWAADIPPPTECH
jgi:hypothetical protein